MLACMILFIVVELHVHVCSNGAWLTGTLACPVVYYIAFFCSVTIISCMSQQVNVIIRKENKLYQKENASLLQ